MRKMLIIAGLFSLVSFNAFGQKLMEDRDGYSESKPGEVPCRFNCALSSSTSQIFNQQQNTKKQPATKQPVQGQKQN